MKIAVIGYSGSGKSTMARQLGQILGYPVLHLDKVQFLTNWQERDTEESKSIVLSFLENPNWVIDGNYSRFYLDRRLEEADKIIFFDFNRFTCFKQAHGRYVKYKNKTRPDMADGCNEKLDYEFVKWLLLDGRTIKRRKKFKEMSQKYSQKIIILKNRAQSEQFANSIINNKVIPVP